MIEYLIGGAGLLAALCSAAVCVRYRRKIENSYDRLEERLNVILSGGVPDRDKMLEDTREDKLSSMTERAFNSLQSANRAGEAEREAVKGLIGDISHQLKTPLAGICLETELLREETLTREEQLEFADRIHDQAEKMQWLLSQLVKISRLETGAITFQAEPLGLKQTLADAVAGVYDIGQRREIEIQTEEFQDITVVHNRRWTAEAIMNILENALKYSPAGKPVNIRVQPLELFVRIEIRDWGPGIEKEDYTKIFKRFYRGENGKTVPGSGLGLYLTQLILSREGGYAAVESGGAGSTFFVMLPRAGK
ncbi:HAMP domain-containing sensor histidine kinase [Anaerolentibacter hominis]|uniref:sensor histidine kinase n=1 Tax=Anaerolentibacter hominis TaxID=3079009 RepID=UPI0031B81D02